MLAFSSAVLVSMRPVASVFFLRSVPSAPIWRRRSSWPFFSFVVSARQLVVPSLEVGEDDYRVGHAAPSTVTVPLEPRYFRTPDST